MTTSVREQVDRTKNRKVRARRRTFTDELVAALAVELEVVRGVVFPTDRYRTDPVAFFREILGVEPWARQIDVLRALIEYDRVAVKSGRRVGKSAIVAAVALWWYCSWPDARVIMSSTTARQVDTILWRELSMMRARAGRCVACKAADPEGHKIPAPCPHSAKIDGDIGMLARTGLVSTDFREVKGFTAREAEAVQGIAGSRLLFLIDEASGVPQPIYDAIEGNRAGGGKVLLTGNPTKNKGEFFDAFNKKKLDPRNPESTGYFGLTISSEESPNVVAGHEVIGGLATASYIREREIEWGRDSALFKIHVSGEFALAEEGRIFSVAAIRDAEERWHDAAPSGRLYLGCDPAGASGTGDESGFALRRGAKVLSISTRRGLSDEGHLVEIVGLLKGARIPRETPVVVIDREGPIGWSLYNLLHNHAQKNPKDFEIVGLRSSERAKRQPLIYDRLRDELCANLEQWLRDGGAIPEDTRLADEMNTFSWEVAINGRLKATRKDDVRKALGRSPDRFDALALSAWEPLSLRDQRRAKGARRDDDDDDPRPIDPYARPIDPYGGGIR